MSSFQETVVIVNKLGLHARACATFVKHAAKFESEVTVKRFRKNVEVNGKSILGMMMLAASAGTRIIIKTDGPDAEEALTELAELVRDGFGEEI